MNAKNLFFGLLIAVVFSVTAYGGERALYRYIDKELYGFIDENGVVIIAAKFDDASPFSGNYAVVKAKERTGIIDKAGKEVIPIGDYDIVNGFSEGLAVVGKILPNGRMRFGYVNEQGQLAIGLRYSGAWDFKEGLAVVNVNGDSKQYRPFLDSFSSGMQGTYGYIDKKGDYYITPIFSKAECFSEGFAWVWRDGNTGGYIDKSRNVVILKNIGGDKFKNGVATFMSLGDSELFGKIGLIDETMNIVVSPRYSYISNFVEGLAVVKKDKKCGYINKKGKEITKIEFVTCEDFIDGVATVIDNTHGAATEIFLDYRGRKVNIRSIKGASKIKVPTDAVFSFGRTRVKTRENRYIFVDTKGTKVIDATYYSAGNFKDNTSKVCFDGYDNCGIVNLKGDVLRRFKGFPLKQLPGGFYIISNFKTYSMTDKDGNTVLEDCDYIDAINLEAGILHFKKNDKYGYVSVDGKIVTDAVYKGASFWGREIKDKGMVTDGKNIYIINRTGQIEQTFDSVESARKNLGME